jgi:hypothetical protein
MLKLSLVDCKGLELHMAFFFLARESGSGIVICSRLQILQLHMGGLLILLLNSRKWDLQFAHDGIDS